jgi:hypothetical protein
MILHNVTLSGMDRPGLGHRHARNHAVPARDEQGRGFILAFGQFQTATLEQVYFPSLPWPIRGDWNRLERLHLFVLELSFADGPAQHKDTWRKSMRQIRTLAGVDSLTPVHAKIRMLHESDCIALPPRTPLLSIVIPSSRLLDKLDPHRAMSIDDLRETIRPGRHLFEDMLANPIQFESDHPEMPLKKWSTCMSHIFWWNQSRRSGVAGDRGSACVSLSCRLLYVVTVYSLPWFMTRHSNSPLNILQRNWRKGWAKKRCQQADLRHTPSVR